MAFTYVARQPIFDRSLAVVGYELLFRANATTSIALFSDADAATSTVLVSTFSDIALEPLLDDKPAYIKVANEILLKDIPSLLSPHRVVIEIRDDIGESPDVRDTLTQMCRQGYRIALEAWNPSKPLSAVAELASTFKIDMRSTTAAMVTGTVDSIHARGAIALAEKIETQAELDECKKAGFDQFQGSFLSKPRPVEHRTVPVQSIELLRLLHALQDTESSAEDIALVVRRDIGLSVRILRVANSAFFSLPRKVESISEAVVLLGTNRITRWAVLLTMASVASKPVALTSTGLARARMCELLANHVGTEAPESYFTVGLFSILDALLDLPMQQVLQSLPLSVDLNDALLNRSGALGNMLSLVCAYEQGDWDSIDQVDIDREVVRQAFLDSCAWADEAVTQVSA